MKIGRLEKIKEVKMVSGKEVSFSDWLSTQDALDELSKQTGLSQMTLIGRESKVANKRLDIYAKETDAPENKVVIENQYGKSDTSHLSRLCYYTVGKIAKNKDTNDDDVKTAILICEYTSKEAVDFIETLNNLVPTIDFWLIEVSFWKIDDSSPAPYFKTIIKPSNDEKIKRMKEDVSEKEISSKYYENIWSKFKDFAFNGDEYDISEYFPNFKYKTQIDRYYFSVTSTEYFGCTSSIGLSINKKEKYAGIYFHRKDQDYSKLVGKFDSFKELFDLECGELIYNKNGEDPSLSFRKSLKDPNSEKEILELFKIFTVELKKISKAIKKNI